MSAGLFDLIKRYVKLAVWAGVEEALSEMALPDPDESQLARDVKARLGRVGLAGPADRQQPALQPAQQLPPAGPEKRGPGRPSNAERQARQAGDANQPGQPNGEG